LELYLISQVSGVSLSPAGHGSIALFDEVVFRPRRDTVCGNARRRAGVFNGRPGDV
jgi:hypothetical protein